VLRYQGSRHLQVTLEDAGEALVLGILANSAASHGEVGSVQARQPLRDLRFQPIRQCGILKALGDRRISRVERIAAQQLRVRYGRYDEARRNGDAEPRQPGQSKALSARQCSIAVSDLCEGLCPHRLTRSRGNGCQLLKRPHRGY
jgi:hypothetical protein